MSFRTDAPASGADIPGAVADRFSLKITCRAVKQVVGAVHLCLGTCTITDRGAGLAEAG